MTREGPLHSIHRELGAKFTDFGGWSMPVQYESVVAEHMAVREHVGWFDVSHLGRFRVSGSEARRVISSQTTIDAESIEVNGSKYGLVLTEAGGIADDIVIWQPSLDEFIVLPNAANHPMVMQRFSEANPQDLRETTAMLAVQGPDAPALLAETVGFEGKRFSSEHAPALSATLVAGTGYTGERGGEIIVDLAGAEGLVRDVITAGATACGLGSRDTLRLEAGLPLWGQDMDASTNPFEAGLGFAVDMSHEFIGRESLDIGTPSKRVLFTTGNRRIPRMGQPLIDEVGSTVGRVTSGSFSPVRSEGIGMGLLDIRPDTLAIDMRGTTVPVEPVVRRFI